jgi:hypothetical protein
MISTGKKAKDDYTFFHRRGQDVASQPLQHPARSGVFRPSRWGRGSRGLGGSGTRFLDINPKEDCGPEKDCGQGKKV